jgi:multidrug resistance efflux pump
MSVTSRAWGLSALGLIAVALGCLTSTTRRQDKGEPVSGGTRLATAERRAFTRTLRLHGVVEATRSHTVAAPRLAGPGMGALVITKLVPSGSKVHNGDLLVEFDRQAQIKAALDKQAEYRDLLERIRKKEAEQAATRAHDETELRQAENAVGTARLEMRKNEVVSRIDAEKNQQALEEAEARLAQLRETFALKLRAASAEQRILEIQRDRAGGAWRHSEGNAAKMSIRSPLDGLVVLNTIWKGGQMGEVQEGDEVRAGVPFLQVVNPEAMQVRARVNQADVPLLAPDLPVQVRLDAYPRTAFPGRLRQMAAIGTTSGLSQKVRTFIATFSIEGADPKLMPDLSAAIDVELQRLPQALVVPRDAVVFGEGEPYVQVRTGSSFTRRPVKTGPMNDHEVVLESGLDPGAVVRRRAGAAGGG